ncbi:MAG TPA: inactive transglutaminase family protein [Cellvibrionaceae bacterium]
MIQRLPFYLMITLLLAVGLVTAWLRHTSTGVPLLPGEQKPVWLIEARIDFVALAGPTTVRLDLPDSPTGFRLVREHSASPGYGFSVINEDGDRSAEWTKREASGPQTLYYNAQYIPGREYGDLEPLSPPEPEAVFWSEPEATAARELLRRAMATSSTPASTARELIKLLNNPAPDQNAALLLGSVENRVELLVKLLNQSGVVARTAMALQLQDARRRQQLTQMLEVYTGKEWLLINAASGEQGLPPNVLLWSRGVNARLDVIGGRGSSLTFSMIEQTAPALALSREQTQDNIFSLLGVSRLPIEEQSMFKMLFLLPLGALVVVFMRIVIGLKTAGTFMPILISLAFMQTTLLPGVVSFVLIVSLGLMFRTYLSYLNLLMVARIATLVVLVILLISVLSLLGYKLGVNSGIAVTFFPMIIIAWTIERMSILWEEEGPNEVMMQGGGSLLVAVIAYLLMTVPVVSHLSFNFPELNLVILAFILLMGQYTGYKLSELRRFRHMGAED